MKKNKKYLEDTIIAIVQHFNSKEIIQVSKYIQKKYGIFFGQTLSYFNFSVPLSEATEKELYFIAKGINEYFNNTINDKYIDLETIFTELEIKDYNNSKFDLSKKNSEKNNNIIELENVSMNDEQHFIVPVVSYKTIVDILNRGLITYNFNTQREPNYFKFNDQVIKKPFLNKKSVNEITKLMINNEFFSNTISFNVRYITGIEKITYDSFNKIIRIKIEDCTFLDIVDGYHRLISLSKALSHGVNGNMSVKIFHHTEEKISKYIIQESKQNKMNEDHLLKLNNDDEWVGLARVIDNYGNQSTNVLYNKILNDNIGIKFKTFVKLLKESFKDNYKKPSDALVIKHFIVEGFNEIKYHNLFDKFGDNEESKYKKSLELLSNYYNQNKNINLELKSLAEEVRKAND